MFIPLVHKRIEFKQEEEVRLIHSIKTEFELNEYWKAQPNPIGKKIAVNVANLVDSIYTPPTCDESQIEKVKKIVEKYNFNFKILKSGLSIEPYY
jgi:alkyl hydroperoxide reductase subunit AhpF